MRSEGGAQGPLQGPSPCATLMPCPTQTGACRGQCTSAGEEGKSSHVPPLPQLCAVLGGLPHAGAAAPALRSVWFMGSCSQQGSKTSNQELLRSEGCAGSPWPGAQCCTVPCVQLTVLTGVTLGFVACKGSPRARLWLGTAPFLPCLSLKGWGALQTAPQSM